MSLAIFVGKIVFATKHRGLTKPFISHNLKISDRKSSPKECEGKFSSTRKNLPLLVVYFPEFAQLGSIVANKTPSKVAIRSDWRYGLSRPLSKGMPNPFFC